MSPKVMIPVLASALALAPAAFLAQRNQVRLRAYEGGETAVSRAAHVVRASRPPLPTQAIELAPVRIDAVRQPQTRSPATGCGAWRSLQASPRGAAAAGPMVRACDGDQLGALEPRPASARMDAPPTRTREPWQFDGP